MCCGKLVESWLLACVPSSRVRRSDASDANALTVRMAPEPMPVGTLNSLSARLPPSPRSASPWSTASFSPSALYKDWECTSREEAALVRIEQLLFSIDPITLTRTRPPSVVFRILRGRVMIGFHAVTLTRYILATGDLCDPVARAPYARHELMRLQRTCRINIVPIEALRHDGLRGLLKQRARLRAQIKTASTRAVGVAPSPDRDTSDTEVV